MRRQHWLTLGLTVLLLITLPIIYIQAQQLQSVRTILNDVWDKANRQLMTTAWIGGAASGQAFQSEQTIYNDVWDAPNHMLRTSGGGGAGGSGGPFNLTTTGVNSGQVLTVGNGSSLVKSGTGIIEATKWDIAPNPCGTNTFVTGQNADKSLTCNQPAFSNLTGVATDAQIPDVNTLSTSLTPGRCVEVDGTGKLSNAAQACGSGSGGGGDASTNTVTSVDGEITLFSGTGGKLLKRATTTGMLRASAGVLTAAVAGTDYVLPSGNVATASGWDIPPAPCGTNQFVVGQNANKSLNCSQPVFSNLSGVATDPQIPDLNSLSTGLTPSKCVETDASGKLVSTASSCSAGGGGGDASTNTAVSVDSEIALFSGAGGKTLKRATTTGLLKASAGVLSAAVAGTDYVTPGGNVATASQLATDPAACPAGTFVTDMNATGLLTCTVPLFSNLSGVASDAQIPDINTLSTSLTPGRCVQVDGTGRLSNAAAACGGGTGGGGGFDTLTSGVNSGATMVVTTGASISATGSGSITATALTGIPDLSVLLTTTNTRKVTNKQIVPRVVALTASGSPLTVSPAPDCDAGETFTLDAIAGDLTIPAPTCTGTNPESEQEIDFRFFSSTPRALTWNAAYCANNGIALPTGTTGDGATYDRFKFRRNNVSSCWGIVANLKGVQRGVTTLASSATYTCDPRVAESCEMQNTLTAGTGVTLAIPAATYVNGTKVLMRIRCTGTQALTLPTGTFLGSTSVPLTGMSCTSNSYWAQLGFIYSGVDTKWQLHAFVN